MSLDCAYEGCGERSPSINRRGRIAFADTVTVANEIRIEEGCRTGTLLFGDERVKGGGSLESRIAVASDVRSSRGPKGQITHRYNVLKHICTDPCRNLLDLHILEHVWDYSLFRRPQFCS